MVLSNDLELFNPEIRNSKEFDESSIHESIVQEDLNFEPNFRLDSEGDPHELDEDFIF
jgi:hypothetical protein